MEFENGTDGHNVPTGFDAERLVWLHVTVTDVDGRVVFESGDLDPNGDVRDSHSVYVHNGALPADDQLFSLQSRFLVRMVRGGEREQVLVVPYSADPLVFLRPSTSATVLTGRPVNARKHRRTIPPLESKWASYRVAPDALEGTTGPYYATVRIKAGMVPVNLVHEIADVGFVEELAGNGPSRTRAHVETLPAFLGAGNLIAAPRSYDGERVPRDLHTTATARAVVETLRNALERSGEAYRRDSAAAAWHAEQLVWFFCATFGRSIAGVQVRDDGFIAITAEFSGDVVVKATTVVGPDGTCACRISAGATHLAATAPDARSFQDVLRKRLTEVGVHGDDGDAGNPTQIPSSVPSGSDK